MILTSRISHQILSVFDHRTGEPVGPRVLPQRIAFKPTMIGHVVANNQLSIGFEARQQRVGQPPVVVRQDRDVPGPRHALPDVGH